MSAVYHSRPLFRFLRSLPAKLYHLPRGAVTSSVSKLVYIWTFPSRQTSSPLCASQNYYIYGHSGIPSSAVRHSQPLFRFPRSPPAKPRHLPTLLAVTSCYTITSPYRASCAVGHHLHISFPLFRTPIWIAARVLNRLTSAKTLHHPLKSANIGSRSGPDPDEPSARA